MSQVYCTATIELKDFDNPREITDYLKQTGLEASYEKDVVFVGSTVDEDNPEEALSRVIAPMVEHMRDDHDILVVSCDGEDNVDSFEIIVKNRVMYVKSARPAVYLV